MRTASALLALLVSLAACASRVAPSSGRTPVGGSTANPSGAGMGGAHEPTAPGGSQAAPPTTGSH